MEVTPMSTKRVYILLIIILTNILTMISGQGIAFAEDHIVLKQVYAWDRYIDVFVSEDLAPDALSVKVSNKDATIEGSGVCVDQGMASKTTILIDVSQSMPKSQRGQVLDLLNSSIESIGAGEEVKIVAFDESLTTLSDFTADRYDLLKSIEEIKFEGKQSIIYDAIYNTMPEVGPIEGNPCFYRTIVITDGVDDTESGVTKEELFLELKNKTYPIDVIEVSKASVGANKNLAALSRISGGNYTQLNGNTDLNVLLGDIKLNQMFWIRAIVPEGLSDGAVRQIDIDDGVHSIQFDTKVMVYDVKVTEEVNNEGSQVKDQIVENVESTLENSNDSRDDLGRKLSKGSLIMWIMPIIAIIGIIVIVVTLSILKKKNGRQKNVESNIATLKVNQHEGKNENMTEHLEFDKKAVAIGIPEEVRLYNTNDPNQVWHVKLDEDILIGRETDCKVCLSESSVSRRHCKLVKVGVEVQVINMSTSNMTLLNGELLSEPKNLRSGDKVECGRVTLAVELLHQNESAEERNLNRGTELINI